MESQLMTTWQMRGRPTSQGLLTYIPGLLEIDLGETALRHANVIAPSDLYHTALSDDANGILPLISGS